MGKLVMKIETESDFSKFKYFIGDQLLEKQNYDILVNARVFIDKDAYFLASLDFNPENADAYQYMLEVLELCDNGSSYGLTLTITNVI